MIGMILIQVLVSIFIIVKLIRDVLVQVKTNVAFIRDIWRDQVIQALWLEIKFSLEIKVMKVLILFHLLLGVLIRRQNFFILKKLMVYWVLEEALLLIQKMKNRYLKLYLKLI